VLIEADSVRQHVKKRRANTTFGRIDAGSVLEIGRLAAFESVKWTAEKRGRVETVAT
jgi:hypothetical protein